MITLNLITIIKAPVQTVFDLSRNIDLHATTMQHTGEQAVAGTTTGLIGLNETVTWRARHFGLMLSLTTKITAMENPHQFTDEQVRGPFKRLHHVHRFEQTGGGGTRMIDEFQFESPCGWLGRLTDRLILKRYLTRLLQHRNEVIKNVAEQLVKLNALNPQT
ncbi:ligand-binding SRPBCC domain-containing protein [Mucilaginibacter yixingensis]|uniref:Ligand-binding SRPBCC domain-containing protein n=1 Tax=Mucilaginibacter yixingensis TaxID=1295612 RepID=A0A2T5JCR7_9SPHI|nr:SRPBCC family protein [Mucilaginibacter yixingensis]PTQ99556.1 ligand-binding SRPBCC domain-containing protein [Mucilaginibacter yixingensis]